jgi:hypothetical protein
MQRCVLAQRLDTPARPWLRSTAFAVLFAQAHWARILAASHLW